MTRTDETGRLQVGDRDAAVFLALLATFVFLLAGYTGLRYNWHGLDIDAINLGASSRSVLTEGTLSPSAGGYPYGYAYPALNTFLAHLTGLSLDTLQRVVQPFLVAMLVPMAFATYRSLLGSTPVALLAAMLLFLSPEFLFEATRSSHGKVTWLLALTTLFILARSFRSASSPRRLVTWIILLYLAAYALVSSSAFFASGYIFGIAVAFAGSYILPYLARAPGLVSPALRRLSYVAVSMSVIVFVFIFYLYPPAIKALWSMRWVIDQLSVFFLSVEPTPGTNPYSYVQATWLSTQVYLALAAFNWIFFVLSFVVWLRSGWSLLVRGESMPSGRLLLWLLYGSFGLLMSLSVGMDVVGVLSANLQVRLFPHLLLVGIALATQGIAAAMQAARRSKAVIARRLAPIALVVLTVYFSIGALLKITNEPSLNNFFPFYTSSERLSVEWIGQYVPPGPLWQGRDGRLYAVGTAFGRWTERRIWVEWTAGPEESRYVLASEISEYRGARIQEAGADTRAYNRVYDSGGATLYDRRPQTPYQR